MKPRDARLTLDADAPETLSALDVADAPPRRPTRVRCASGAEVEIDPEADLLRVHLGEGHADLEIRLTPTGAVVRTTGPELAFEAPEQLTLRSGHFRVEAREADIVTQADLRLRGARIFLN